MARLLSLALLLSTACSSRDDGRVPLDSGRSSDSGVRDSATADASGELDASQTEDASADDAGGDAGGATDAGSDGGVGSDGCVPPPCPAPPEGCHYEGSTMCTCGTLVCSATCGGFIGLTCASDAYCDYPAGMPCGIADGTGVCMPRPFACPDVYMPVCGCDGVTYGNACEAHAAGTDVSSDGEC